MANFLHTLFGFLRKFFGSNQIPRQTNEDSDIERFYTDSQYVLQIFEQLVDATIPSKRILVIHGIGGVGKSTLLKVLGFSCRRYLCCLRAPCHAR
jgi:ABC-type proline/glycine betaine transport system ATPase subunit